MKVKMKFLFFISLLSFTIQIKSLVVQSPLSKNSSYWRENPLTWTLNSYLDPKILRLDARPRLAYGPRKKREVVYYDPQFGIPLAYPPPLIRKRIYPIGPFVQPTLLENWVSAMFEASISYPEAFTIIKKISSVGLIISLIFVWGWIGSRLGIVRLGNSRSVIHEGFSSLTEKIILSLDDGNKKWSDQLGDIVSKTDAFKDVTSFACCLLRKDDNDVETKRSNDFFKCYPDKKKKRSGNRKTISCLSDFIYTVVINTTRN